MACVKLEVLRKYGLDFKTSVYNQIDKLLSSVNRKMIHKGKWINVTEIYIFLKNLIDKKKYCMRVNALGPVQITAIL